MVAELCGVIDEGDLTDADRSILDALQDGPLTKGAIVDETGLHRNTVGNRLDALKFGEAIEAIHDRTALYELRNDPREDADLEGDGESSDVDEACADLERALENREWSAVEDAAARLGCDHE